MYPPIYFVSGYLKWR